jgi:hypothetical protein
MHVHAFAVYYTKGTCHMEENKSEVARMMRQITQEYEAAKMGMNGPACGTSRHRFITKRMENIGQLHENLTTLVGPEQATICMTQALEQAKERPTNELVSCSTSDERSKRKEGVEDGKR